MLAYRSGEYHSLLKGQSAKEAASKVFVLVLLVAALMKALAVALDFAVLHLDLLLYCISVLQICGFVQLVRKGRPCDVSGAMLVLLTVTFCSNLAATHTQPDSENEWLCYMPDHEGTFWASGLMNAGLIGACGRCLWWWVAQRPGGESILATDECRWVVACLAISSVLSFCMQSACVHDEHIFGHDFLYMCSNLLEFFAMVPQFWRMARSGGAERATSNFVAVQLVAKAISAVFFLNICMIHTQAHHVGIKQQQILEWSSIIGMVLPHVICVLAAMDYMYHYVKTLHLERLELARAEACPV